MRPRAKDFIMHLDDGLVDGLELPKDADTVRLLDGPRVNACRAATAAAVTEVMDVLGRALPIRSR